MTTIEFNRVYRFKNVQGGTCLDLSGVDNHSLIGFEQTAGANQMWTFHNADGDYYIKSVSQEEYLSIAGEPGNGQAIVVSPTPFTWEVKIIGDAISIYVPGTNYCVDLDGGNPAPSTPVLVWEAWGGQNQLWKPIMLQ